jgi:hypothetical protein
MRATGQNALTMVAIVPAVLCALLGLSAAAMVRAASGMRALWVPIVALLAWTAFGDIGIVGGHVDNLLNAAFVVAGFAAACAFAAWRRGVVAVALFFMAAALAEWPFYAFAMGIFLLGLALFCAPALLRRGRGLETSLPVVVPLLGATGASVVFLGLTFFALPSNGWIGVRIKGGGRKILRDRFIERLHQTIRYWAFPLAGLGAFFLAGRSGRGSRPAARSLFLSLMTAWVLTSIVAGIAQLAGIPVAGGRLLSFLFAIPILTGVFLWAISTGAARRYGRAGAAVGAVITIGVAGAFGLAANKRMDFRPWMEPAAVRQAAFTAEYMQRFAPTRDVVFIMRTSERRDNTTIGRWWNVVRAILPADQVPRAHRFIGSPQEYESALRSDGPSPAGIRAIQGSSPVEIVIQAYNPAGFDWALLYDRGDLVAPGVLTLNGPVPRPPLESLTLPQAATTRFDLAWISVLVLLVLFVAGSGWAALLLPADPVVRMALAPVVGAAATSLVALAWAAAGFPFGRATGLGPLAVTAVVGWIALWAHGRDPRARRSTADLGEG